MVKKPTKGEAFLDLLLIARDLKVEGNLGDNNHGLKERKKRTRRAK